MNQDPIVVVSYARTPLGAFQGSLAALTASHLGGIAIANALAKSEIEKNLVNEVIMGCVLPAGQGQAPARQAAFHASLSKHTSAITVNKICGSGMMALMLACDRLQAGSVDVVVAGGMESMTNAPYLVDKARGGYRMGHGRLLDHMFLDGLEDAYDRGKLMGFFADATADKYDISRKTQDDFTLASLEKAKQATEQKWFEPEIAAVEIQTKKSTQIITTDEVPLIAKPEKIPALKPAFSPEGTVTAANASSISDGAAALVLMRESTAKQHQLKPIAKILDHCAFAHEPEWFTTAPVGAIERLLEKLQLSKNDIDLYEINEAFAVVTLAAVQSLDLDMQTVNVFGGACALGHPIGASGARIVCTLLTALQQQQKSRGLASLCIGGGEATAMALELV